MANSATKPATMGLLVGGLFPDDPQFAGSEEFQYGVQPFAVDVSGGVYLHMQQGAVVKASGAMYNTAVEVLGPMGGVYVYEVGEGTSYYNLPLTMTSTGQLITVDAASSATGSAVPTTATLVGGSDGTDLRALSVSSAGVLNVSDVILDATVKAAGAAKASTGVQVGGNDGTYFRPFLTDTTGQLKVLAETDGTIGTTPPTTATQIGGTDGTYLRALSVTAGGVLNVTDATLDGTVQGIGYPIVATSGIMMVGTDGTNGQPLQVDGSGYLEVNVKAGSSSGAQPTGTTGLTEVVPMGAAANGEYSGPLEPLISDGSGYLMVDIAATANGPVSTHDQTLGELVLNEGSPLHNTITADGILANSAQDALVVLGYDGSIARQLLTDKTGRQVVVVDALPDLDIEFPDPSNYIDQDVNASVITPHRPAPPNAVQVNLQPTPIVLPTGAAAVANLTRPPWGEPGLAGTSGTLPAGAFYSSNVSPNATSPFSLPLVASGAGQCVVLSVYNLSGTQWASTCALRVRDRSNGVTTGWQITPLLAGESATGSLMASPALLYFNLPVASGDGLVIDVFAAGTLSGFAVTAALAPLPIPVTLRPDGRSLPLGALTVDVSSTTTGNNTVLAATSGFRPMVASIGYLESLATGGVQFGGTINGSFYALAVIGNTVSVIAPAIFPQGVLFDANTALILANNTGTAGDAAVGFAYDLVPA